MTTPKISWQTTFVPPESLHVEIALTWHQRADHSICRLRVSDRPNGQLISLSVGATPDFRDTTALEAAIASIADNLAREIHRHIVEVEPF
uniref:Uncharacterized protein n=1 Tax=uncultured prokaryote TaxID=198431 RepID=A0A0H5Q776_9ZZZZ|nr:hypothetical protein [uncultured prokaryote]